MQNLKFSVLTGCILVAGCGGGGTTTTPINVAQTPLSTLTIVENVEYEFKNGHTPWVNIYITNDDGTETLIVSSMDKTNYYQHTEPTPVYAFKINNNKVEDITDSIFNTTPKFYGVRTIRSFIHPKTKTKALWFCNTGREVGVPEISAAKKINGLYQEQDALYVMNNGKFIDNSVSLPQEIDFSHGCDILQNTEETYLIKNTMPAYYKPETVYAYKLVDDKWVSELPYEKLGFTNTISWKNWDNLFKSTWVAAIKLTNSIHGFIFGNGIVKKENNTYSYELLPSTDLDNLGYTHVQGSVTGDLNNDNLEDLILVKSNSAWEYAKIEIWFNDGKGKLNYKPTTITGKYEANDFGTDLRLIDINFDGHLDIVTFGARYNYNCNPSPSCYHQKTNKVLINNGDNTFTPKIIDDPRLTLNCTQNCQVGTFFLKQSNNSYGIIVWSTSGDYNVNKFSAKTFTKEDPVMVR